VEEVRAGYRMEWGDVRADVIAPPPGKLFSETNDNSVAILLSYSTARVLLAGDAEGRKEEYMAGGPLHRATDRHQRSETTHSLSQGSASCWAEESPRWSQRWSNGYVLVLCSWDCVQGIFSGVDG
jgi:hypothetical protein